MCGIIFISDLATTGQYLTEAYGDITAGLLKFRGPDAVRGITGEHFFAQHSLLSVTGSTPQPCRWRDGIFLFNGEIYNEWEKYSELYGDADFLKRILDQEGIEVLKRLDGEFALVVFDEARNLVHLCSDTFGTKPLYFALEGKRFGAATFDYVLHDCGFSETVRVPANSWITIDLHAEEIHSIVSVFQFDFCSPNERDYAGFSHAFSAAISKRALNVKCAIHVPLSSGHDSGLIAAELIDQNINFSAYGFIFGEVEEVIVERFRRLRQTGLRAELLDPSNLELTEIESTLIAQLPAFHLTVGETPALYEQPDFRHVPGFISSAYIARLARSRGEIICLSGQGADEIISDYYNEHSNSRRSFFRGNWEAATKPWPNFFGGWTKVFLEASERVVGHFGIETRYPFLDRQVVQSFLNLTPEAKGRAYKACMSDRLKQLQFPMHNRKIGFNGFDTTCAKRK